LNLTTSKESCPSKPLMEKAEDQQFEPTPPSEGLPKKRVNMAVTLAICLGGWLVPGLCHILLGKWVRGLIFSFCVLTMFMLGLAMHGKLYDLAVEQPLHIFAFFANLGVGLPYLLAERMNLGIGEMTRTTYDYGTTYLWVCGLLNYLVILDAFDIAQGRKP
jgi:hypothetical protein